MSQEPTASKSGGLLTTSTIHWLLIKKNSRLLTYFRIVAYGNVASLQIIIASSNKWNWEPYKWFSWFCNYLPSKIFSFKILDMGEYKIFHIKNIFFRNGFEIVKYSALVIAVIPILQIIK